PYAAFNAIVAQRIKDAYEGPMAMMAAGPEAVAVVIERAISAKRPKTRYPVTFAARFLMGLRRWLPDRAFDAFLKTQFPGSAERPAGEACDGEGDARQVAARRQSLQGLQPRHIEEVLREAEERATTDSRPAGMLDSRALHRNQRRSGSHRHDERVGGGGQGRA